MRGLPLAVGGCPGARSTLGRIRLRPVLAEVSGAGEDDSRRELPLLQPVPVGEGTSVDTEGVVEEATGE